MFTIAWLLTESLRLYAMCLLTWNPPFSRVPLCAENSEWNMETQSTGMLWNRNAANICCCGIIRCMMMHVFIVPRCQCTTLPEEVVLAWRRTRQSVAGLFRGQGKVHSLPRRSWLTFPLHFLALARSLLLFEDECLLTHRFITCRTELGQLSKEHDIAQWQCCALRTDRLLLLVDGFLLEMASATCSSRPGFTWVWQQRTGETLEREAERLNLLCNASIEACFCSSSTGVWLSYIFSLQFMERTQSSMFNLMFNQGSSCLSLIMFNHVQT